MRTKKMMNTALRNTVFAALVLAFYSLPLLSSAQCTPDQSMLSATHYPTTLATGCVGQPYEETIFITFPDDSVVSGANVIFDHFEIVSNSLPAGLTYTCNVPNCKWTPNNTPLSQELMFGCITISGTPTAPFSGQFTIDIEGCGTVIIITQCETEVIPFDITILPAPTADYNTRIIQNQVAFNDLSSTVGADTIVAWRWDFGDGNTSALQNPTHVYASTGNYAPCLTINTANCSQQHCSSLDILAVNADPFMEFARQVSISPNPIHSGSSAGTINVEMGQATQPWIGLRSIEGKLLQEWQFPGSRIDFRCELPQNEMPHGLYFLDIQAKEGSVVKKILID